MRDPLGVITRIYTMEYGEGINKLNPNGKSYIEAPVHMIEKYGIEKNGWMDVLSMQTF
ncbi:hypothetical protein [Bacillus toyonensis]|uniref:hypothetical protein n=1 Tax=Bacillus toyonensis TaxID=155322 RepID=UPI0015CF5BD9|nr:hypothetical protein [Bacillus toyonensis]